MSELIEISETLQTGDIAKLNELVKSALDNHIPPQEILNEGLITGMDLIGSKMESGEMFIPEVLMAAHAMATIVADLKPMLADGATSAAGKIVLGSVQGDLHDIGKNLVNMMLESAGFEVIDLGVDVSPDKFIRAIEQNDPDIVALSALLTTTMDMMKKTVEMIDEKGLRDKVKIMIGGAPINQKFADEIGADGYAADAGSASKLAKRLAN